MEIERWSKKRKRKRGRETEEMRATRMKCEGDKIPRWIVRARRTREREKKRSFRTGKHFRGSRASATRKLRRQRLRERNFGPRPILDYYPLSPITALRSLLQFPRLYDTPLRLWGTFFCFSPLLSLSHFSSLTPRVYLICILLRALSLLFQIIVIFLSYISTLVLFYWGIISIIVTIYVIAISFSYDC